MVMMISIIIVICIIISGGSIVFPHKKHFCFVVVVCIKCRYSLAIILIGWVSQWFATICDQ